MYSGNVLYVIDIFLCWTLLIWWKAFFRVVIDGTYVWRCTCRWPTVIAETSDQLCGHRVGVYYQCSGQHSYNHSPHRRYYIMVTERINIWLQICQLFPQFNTVMSSLPSVYNLLVGLKLMFLSDRGQLEQRQAIIPSFLVGLICGVAW